MKKYLRLTDYLSSLPWRVSKDKEGVVFSYDGVRVAEIYGPCDDNQDETVVMNNNELVCANAPDLYKALAEVMETLDTSGVFISSHLRASLQPKLDAAHKLLTDISNTLQDPAIENDDDSDD